MSPDCMQETMEALDLKIWEITFKETQGERLTPVEQRLRLNLINALKRLKREASCTTVHST